MLNTILFDLDGTLLPFVQEEFIRAYFKALLSRLIPMGYDGEKVSAALWKGTTVSYTHLDVYKRQVPDDDKKAPPSQKGKTVRKIFILWGQTMDHRGPAAGSAPL